MAGLCSLLAPHTHTLLYILQSFLLPFSLFCFLFVCLFFLRQELTLQSRLTYWRFSCLRLLHSRITGMCHYLQLPLLFYVSSWVEEEKWVELILCQWVSSRKSQEVLRQWKHHVRQSLFRLALSSSTQLFPFWGPESTSLLFCVEYALSPRGLYKTGLKCLSGKNSEGSSCLCRALWPARTIEPTHCFSVMMTQLLRSCCFQLSCATLLMSQVDKRHIWLMGP